MSRIQDALKKAEEESRASELVSQNQPLAQEPPLNIPVDEPGAEKKTGIVSDYLETEKIGFQPDEIIRQKSIPDDALTSTGA